jgi:flagellar protein FlbD
MHRGRIRMIKVTRFNREVVYVNSDLIEYLETTPDTIISLTTGEKFMVLETPDQIVDLVVAFERRIHCGPVGEADIRRYAEALKARSESTDVEQEVDF